MTLKSIFVGLILFCLICCPGVQAQSDIGFYGIGGKLGLVLPENPIDATFGIGLQAKLGTLVPNLAIDPFLEFWTKGYDDNYLGASADWRYTQFVLGAALKYFFDIDSPMKPYAGGGLAITYSRVSWEYDADIGTEDDSDTDADIGLHLLGGAEMEISDQWDGFAELKYSVDGADYFGIFIGAIYKMK